MQAFFVIAGFLAARSIGKRGRREWLRGRTVQLLIPATVTWLTFSRLTDWVSMGDPFADIILIGHVWFLYTLAAFSLLTFVLEGKLGQSSIKKLAAAVDRAPLALTVGLFLIAAFAGKLMMTATYMASPAIAHGEGIFENLYVLARVPIMLVFYLFGHVIAHCRFIERLHLSPMAMMFVVSLGAYIWLQQPNGYDVAQIPGVPRKVAMLVMYLMFSGAGTFLALTVFAHANVAKSVPAAFMHLSRASYTIYLTHLFYLTALFRWLTPLISDRLLLFSILVGGGMALSLATHEIFSRNRLLTFLFNGKPAPRPSPSPMTPVTSRA